MRLSRLIRDAFKSRRRVVMRKIFACLLCLFVLMTTLAPDIYGQDRRRRSRFGRKARTAAMIAGGAAVGGLVGGKKGAAIGAGGAGIYAFNRKAAHRHFGNKSRTAGTG